MGSQKVTNHLIHRHSYGNRVDSFGPLIECRAVCQRHSPTNGLQLDQVVGESEISDAIRQLDSLLQQDQVQRTASW